MDQNIIHNYNIAKNFRNHKEYEKYIKYIFKTIRLARKMKKNKFYFSYKNELIDFCKSYPFFHKIKKYIVNLINYFKKSKDYEEIINLYVLISDFDKNKIYFYKKALHYAIKIKREFKICRILNQLLLIYINERKYNKFLNYFDKFKMYYHNSYGVDIKSYINIEFEIYFYKNQYKLCKKELYNHHKKNYISSDEYENFLKNF
jgi:hypothetical protein